MKSIQNGQELIKTLKRLKYNFDVREDRVNDNHAAHKRELLEKLTENQAHLGSFEDDPRCYQEMVDALNLGNTSTTPQEYGLECLYSYTCSEMIFILNHQFHHNNTIHGENLPTFAGNFFLIRITQKKKPNYLIQLGWVGYF